MPRRAFAFVAFLTLMTWTARADDPPTIKATLTDAVGKDVSLVGSTFTFGTRKLSFLPHSPEAFELREADSTTFKDGILTFVPLSRLQSITFDAEQQSIAVAVAGVKTPLTGSTRFGVNGLVVEAEVKVGNDGIADVKYRGGVPKNGIRGIRFENVDASEWKPTGEPWTVHIAEAKGKGSAVVVYGLQPLYAVGKGESLMPTLLFKKTLKLDIGQIQKLTVTLPPDKVQSAECDVTTKEGQSFALTLLATMPTGDKTKATLIGLVGRVPGGYRLFPIHTIAGFEQGEPKEMPDGDQP